MMYLFVYVYTCIKKNLKMEYEINVWEHELGHIFTNMEQKEAKFYIPHKPLLKLHCLPRYVCCSVAILGQLSETAAHIYLFV